MDTLILTVLKSDILIYSQKMVTFVIKANVKSFKKKKVILSSCCCDVDVKKLGILQNFIR